MLTSGRKIMLNRRSFFGGLLLLSAPAIIRTPGLLMPIRKPPVIPGIIHLTGRLIGELRPGMIISGTGLLDMKIISVVGDQIYYEVAS
jgi:hypothetical protein